MSGPRRGSGGRRFEELAFAATDRGEISLRRRRDPLLDVDVYEVKLGDEFLMSSLFTAAEVELARLGLAAVPEPEPGPGGGGLDVLVGGLGLGYTAQAVLDDPRVRSLTVVEVFRDVIDWHERGLLPTRLVNDPRTRLVCGDFFGLTAGVGYDPDRPGRRFHAVLLDIDHTPDHLLHPSHAGFYTPDGLLRLESHLEPGGVFGLWSDDPPDARFAAVLGAVFGDVDVHVVDFDNPFTGERSANTVYVAH